MYCNHCGRMIGNDSVFCQYCGIRVGQVPAYPAPRRLYRSRADKMIAGVCAGIARYFDLDPVLVRVLWVLCVLFGGTGLLLYVILWIVMPLEPCYLPAAQGYPAG